MPFFFSYDGTRLAYHLQGEGEPLVCLPGGPALASAYLGDLGGLAAVLGRTLVLLDIRGTGESATPTDTSTYRCDAMVQDVEALRGQLSLDSVDLLGHSAGGSLAVLYATQHPELVRHLVLVTPSGRPFGLAPSDEEWDASMAKRSGEPWYDEALAAMSSEDDSPALNAARAPFSYGRWDQAALQHATAARNQRNDAAAAGYYAEGAIDPSRVRASLRDLTAPVLILVGGLDMMPTVGQAEQMAALVPRSRVHVQEGAGHHPWLDDPRAYTASIAEFLDGPG